MPRIPRTIDGYLTTSRASLGLTRLPSSTCTRRCSIIPEAEECISYRIPAFRLDGRVVAGFVARADGCSYFPFSGTTLKTLAPQLRSYEQTKSSLHFDADTPLPKTLVRRLIKARIAEKH